MIRCAGLAFSYPDGTRALDAIELEIRAGERVAISGRNGSGKSTLVHHWNGLLRPTAGRVFVGGHATEGRRIADLARTVGIAFQDPGAQLFAQTCRDEVAFGPRNLGVRGAALERAVDDALSAVGLDAHGGTNPYDLGLARRKLLAIASVLAMDTPVVVLDEPTPGQDEAGRIRLRSIVENLGAQGRTVVAVTHDRPFIADAFDRLIVLDAGRLVADGPAAGQR